MARLSTNLQLPGRRRVLAGLLGLLHCMTITIADAAEPRQKATTQKTAKQAADPTAMPDLVAEMRDAILAATRSGNIEDLREPLAWNELLPDVADTKVADPIAHWRQVSSDGEGREVLAVLQTLLEQPHTIALLGKDIENNRVFIWPALAERPLKDLTAGEKVTLFRLAPAQDAKAMMDTGRYTGWRLMIGADGTWHSFKRGN